MTQIEWLALALALVVGFLCGSHIALLAKFRRLKREHYDHILTLYENDRNLKQALLLAAKEPVP